MFNQELFKTYFPSGTLEMICSSDVPHNIMTFFEGKSSQFIRPALYVHLNFELFFCITHSNTEKTYGTKQKKSYEMFTLHSDGLKNVEDLIYVADARSDKQIGHGEIRFSDNKRKYFKKKPFVGYTKTEVEYRCQGYGLRRLHMMTVLSQAFWQLPLNSDTNIQEKAKRRWEYLSLTGLATKYKEGKNDRFVFLK